VILLLLLASLSLKGNVINEPVIVYQDKYINAFCSKETDRLIICENDRDSLFGNLSYSRAEFKDGKLYRLDYVIPANQTVAKSISRQLKKLYGNPYHDGDLMPESLNETWSDNLTDITLSYSSGRENGLGHSIIRVSLTSVPQN
jgi:hypothetical protein